ncbi:hypothetical protein C343_05816 [Cryptococcus neoformans C23]|nr:hypothetical protein C347_05855 [Cryptococcus neoformans var. grubii AD2-60a]OWZ39735.1 hypothetical protein C343_05816 [Cryptococcus neoformans var. grubii C23]OXC82219.1 hypothetical protein C344_05534 [Cryptococcus neoformans var. grubii AD1-7a]OXH25697.1 hypothetical protein J005_05668 [Cryptococcus neoformans var. grubii]
MFVCLHLSRSIALGIKMSSTFPSTVATPVPSSPPPPSESYLSELDGTAPSLLETTLGTNTFGIEPAWNSIDGGLDRLNLVSWKADVNAHEGDGVEKRGFNAISTVLSHPIKRADPLRSSRKPLLPLSQPPPTLPKPPPATQYDAYLSTVIPLYESFTAAQAITSEGDSSKANIDLPPLDTVPSVVFDSSFSLADPSTWEALTSSSDNLPDESTQNQLSTHLDTLERHLLYQITLRSTSFFSALSNLQDLHSESSGCLEQITSLQSLLRSISTAQATKGLAIIDSQERLHALKATAKGVEALGEVEDAIRVAERLVNEGDWEGGLSEVEDIVRWWDKYSGQGNESELPLTSLAALSSLPNRVTSLVNLISTSLTSALISYLTSVFSRPISQSPSSDELKGALGPMLEGIVKCGKVGEVENLWTEVATVGIREESRKVLPLNDEDSSGKLETRGNTLAELIQSMDHSAFLSLCTKMYDVLMARITAVKKVGEIMEEVVQSLSSTSSLTITSNPHPRPDRAPNISLSETLFSSVSLAHTRLSKILSVRTSPHSFLSLKSFLTIYRLTFQFITSSEKISGRTIVPLRSVLASQAKSWVQEWHQEHLTKSARLVEEEIWTQVDVKAKIQDSVNLIVRAETTDPEECKLSADEDDDANEKENEGEDDDKVVGKQLHIRSKKFFVVKATAESLAILSEYVGVIINLGEVGGDVISRVIEFLKSFNSRTCQVVLGAGAMRSAGLKNITAKHLALASQSLSVVVALMDSFKELGKRFMGERWGILEGEFGKLRRDYEEHQNEIHLKLVAIMADRLAVHIGSLRQIDFNASSTTATGPHSYAEMLVKESSTLHKVLTKYLGHEEVESIMKRVVGEIGRRLGEEFGKVEMQNEDAKKRMLQDVALISIRLKPLSKAGEDDIVKLENVVKGKTIRETEGKMEVKKESQTVQEIPEEAEGKEKAEEKTDMGQKKIIHDSELAPLSTKPTATEPLTSSIDPSETSLSTVVPAPTSLATAPRAFDDEAYEAITPHPNSQIQSKDPTPRSTSNGPTEAAETKIDEQTQRKLQGTVPVVGAEETGKKAEKTEKRGDSSEAKYKESEKPDKQRQKDKDDLEKTESEQEKDSNSAKENAELAAKDVPIDGEQVQPVSGPAEDQQAPEMPAKASPPSFPACSLKDDTNNDVWLAQTEAEISPSNDYTSLAGKPDSDGVKDEDAIHTPADRDVSEIKAEVDNRDSAQASEGVVEGGKKPNKDEKGDEDEDQDDEEQGRNYQKDEEYDKSDQGVGDEIGVESEGNEKDAKSVTGDARGSKKKKKNRRRR